MVKKSLEYLDEESALIINFFSERILNSEIITEQEIIRKQEQKINRTKMLYKGYRNTYDFAQFKTIKSFKAAIKNGTVMINMAEDDFKKNRQRKLENLLVIQDLKVSA